MLQLQILHIYGIINLLCNKPILSTPEKRMRFKICMATYKPIFGFSNSTYINVIENTRKLKKLHSNPKSYKQIFCI